MTGMSLRTTACFETVATLIADAIDKSVDLRIREILAGSEQHFAEMFFPFDIARIGNSAERTSVIDQRFAAWIEDRVHSVRFIMCDSLNDASRVPVADAVYL